MPSPVAIFVYNRLGNTKATITHLMESFLAAETDVYVFSDGGKDNKSWKEVNAVRDYLHQVEQQVADSHNLSDNEEQPIFKSFTIIERPENFYLERNITEGIEYVLQRHDTIIVLEDDICVSEFYLEYMNTAFQLYRDDRKVMHVAGFSNLDLITDHPSLLVSDKETDAADETYFTPHMSGWGWGTWRDRWQTYFVHYQTEDEALQGLSDADRQNIQYGGVFPCLRSLKKRPIPWDICWEIAIYKAGGLCLTPAHTLVRNIGLTRGTHFSSINNSLISWFEFDREPLDRRIRMFHRDAEVNPEIEQLFKEAIRDWGIRYTPFGKVLRRLKHLLFSNK